jgi:hypothetical protein
MPQKRFSRMQRQKEKEAQGATAWSVRAVGTREGEARVHSENHAVILRLQRRHMSRNCQE